MICLFKSRGRFSWQRALSDKSVDLGLQPVGSCPSSVPFKRMLDACSRTFSSVKELVLAQCALSRSRFAWLAMGHCITDQPVTLALWQPAPASSLPSTLTDNKQQNKATADSTAHDSLDISDGKSWLQSGSRLCGALQAVILREGRCF